mmetsp:Transcript_118345/g.166331  ORF Transcript_118345/g.166331 Transcript_118345/m.166331 type:complete len:274 (+) Transcript_118345:31-852(+)
MEKVTDIEGPRKGALSWDDYFMGLAFLTAMRSKDPSTQVGACIVNDRNRIIGVGYNGMPSNCPNEDLPWGKKSTSGELATKYPYVVHAELNAVLNKNSESCAGCRIYTTLFPCNECAKVIIQAGIQQVIYASDKHSERLSAKASRRLFNLAGVEMRHYETEKELLALPLRYEERQSERDASTTRTHRNRENCASHLSLSHRLPSMPSPVTPTPLACSACSACNACNASGSMETANERWNGWMAAATATGLACVIGGLGRRMRMRPASQLLRFR